MRKIIPVLSAIFILSSTSKLLAQNVAINSDGTTAHPSAMLDVKSSNKGLLAPRMTQVQRDAIVSPAAGLLIYQTDGTSGYHVYNGSSWSPIAGAGSSKWILNGNNIYNSNAGFVGIGTSIPGSGLELKGAGLGAQQRITDPTSGNSLVLQGGAGENLKVTGFNYGTFTPKPLYLSTDGANTIMNPNGGSVGIGTTTPQPGYSLDVRGPVKTFGDAAHFVARATGGTNSWARLYMQGTSQSWFMGTSQDYAGNQLYIGDETFNHTRFSIQPNNGPIYMQGSLGINTTPQPGYLLDVAGAVRNSGDAAHFVANATGGTNSWARFYMRSLNPDQSPLQSWFIGTSKDFIGNQFHLVDETFNHTRFSIQPNNGPIYMSGSVGINTSNTAGYSLAVNGSIHGKEVVVETGWADYVFDKNYKLPSLNELEKFIQQNKHLPNIPSAKEVENKGLHLGDVQKRMMEKIEELTLYIIAQEKRIDEIQKEIIKLKKN